MNKIITIAGSAFVGIMLFFLALFFVMNVSAKTQPPEQVLIHKRVIQAAQNANKAIAPERIRINSQWDANEASAKASRQYICQNFADHCDKETLDPAASGTDISAFLTIPRR
jgi:hypothetical protein